MSDPRPGTPSHVRAQMHGLRQPTDRRHVGPHVTVYVQAQQADPEILTPENQAKIDLFTLFRQSLPTIKQRVNSLPGSSASTQLWVMYRQAQDQAVELGRQGLWPQALAQFTARYQALLSAAPTGDAANVSRSRGTAGVGCNAPGCECPCGGALSCKACSGKRAVADFVAMTGRATRAMLAGDLDEATAMLARARQATDRFEPKDVAMGRATLGVLVPAVQARAAGKSGGVLTLRRGQTQGLKGSPLDYRRNFGVGSTLTDAIFGPAAATTQRNTSDPKLSQFYLFSDQARTLSKSGDQAGASRALANTRYAYSLMDSASQQSVSDDLAFTTAIVNDEPGARTDQASLDARLAAAKVTAQPVSVRSAMAEGAAEGITSGWNEVTTLWGGLDMFKKGVAVLGAAALAYGTYRAVRS